jgi:hypothetical protein
MAPARYGQKKFSEHALSIGPIGLPVDPRLQLAVSWLTTRMNKKPQATMRAAGEIQVIVERSIDTTPIFPAYKHLMRMSPTHKSLDFHRNCRQSARRRGTSSILSLLGPATPHNGVGAPQKLA